MSTSNSYGWVITWATDCTEAGITGPRGVAFPVDQIKAEGREFRMLDDDGEHYYTGFYLGPDDESMFGPLDDFGCPNAGATSIEYRGESGEWKTL